MTIKIKSCNHDRRKKIYISKTAMLRYSRSKTYLRYSTSWWHGRQRGWLGNTLDRCTWHGNVIDFHWSLNFVDQLLFPHLRWRGWWGWTRGSWSDWRCRSFLNWRGFWWSQLTWSCHWAFCVTVGSNVTWGARNSTFTWTPGLVRLRNSWWGVSGRGCCWNGSRRYVWNAGRGR